MEVLVVSREVLIELQVIAHFGALNTIIEHLM